MTLREFLKLHLLKSIIALAVIQMIIFAIAQNFNHRPQANRDQAELIEECTVKITPLSNDFDKDEHTELSIQEVYSPSNGLVEKKKNLLFYTPKAGFIGLDSFAYTITDSDKESKKGFIVVKVNENLEPIAKSDSIEIYLGGSAFIDVLSNDNDRENDSIYIKEYTNPLYGKAKLEENKFIYLASNSISQPDSFHYVISDGKSNSLQVSVFINVKSKNDPCYPWLSQDIGDYSIPGSIKCSKNTMIIEASGSDIWGNVDGFHYAYQYISGNCEMLTKIENIEANHDWAKAAIMVRETLSGGSKTSMVLLANTTGARSQNRFDTNGATSGSEPHTEIKAPYWLKLVRKGDSFTYFISENGINWENIDSQENLMSKNVHIGLAFTSHNNNNLDKAVFSNYRLNARVAKIGDTLTE